MTAGPVGFHGDVNIAEVGGVVLASGSVPVTIVGGGGGGGTEYAEDSAHISGDLGTQILAVRNDTPGSLVDTDGDYGSVQLDSVGRIRVTVDNSPAVSISGTVDVSGSTVTVQEPLSVDDGGGSLTVDGAIDVSGSTVAISGVVDVSGSTVTIQEPLSVDDNGGSLTVDDGGSSLTVDGAVTVSGTVAVSSVGGTVTVAGTVAVGSSVTPGTGATNLGKAEDAAHASGDVGVMALAVRNDAGTVLAGTTGDYIPLSTDDVGRLRVLAGSVIPGTGATNLGKAEDAAHLSGDVGVMSLAVRNDSGSVLAGTTGDYIPLTTDNSGRLRVLSTNPTHDNLQANVTLQLQDTDVVAGSGLATQRTVRVPVQNYGYSGYPQLTFNLSNLAETFGVSMVDPSAITAAGVNSGLGGLSGSGGALRTGPDRDTIVSLFSATTFNNTTTSANSSTIACETARWALVHIQLSESGSATDIRLIAQFSVDGGTTWTDYAVDQWVDLRYVPSQMPLAECIPLNYVIGTDFRLRAVATGTTSTDTITLTADVEFIS